MSFASAFQYFVDVERKLADNAKPITEREALEGLAFGLQELTRAIEAKLEAIDVKVASIR